MFAVSKEVMMAKSAGAPLALLTNSPTWVHGHSILVPHFIHIISQKKSMQSFTKQGLTNRTQTSQTPNSAQQLQLVLQSQIHGFLLPSARQPGRRGHAGAAKGAHHEGFHGRENESVGRPVDWPKDGGPKVPRLCCKMLGFCMFGIPSNTCQPLTFKNKKRFCYLCLMQFWWICWRTGWKFRTLQESLIRSSDE